MRTLHLYILSSLALAQPLFSLLSGNSTFLVAHGSQPVDILLLVLSMMFILPTIFVLLTKLASLISGKLGQIVHALFFFLLLAALCLPFLKHLSSSSTVVFPAAAMIAGLAVAAYYRWKTVPLFLNFLSPALVLVPALFLLAPQIETLFAEESRSGITGKQLKSKVPIVFIVLDELPLTSLLDNEGAVDGVRYPNFARLANHSTWFRNDSAVSMLTHSAVPAILTGKYPTEWYSPTMRDYPQNLFTLLEDKYRMHVFETVTRLAPRSVTQAEAESLGSRMQYLMADVAAIYLHIILPDDLAARLPSVTDTWDDFWNNNRQAAPDDTIHPRRDRTEFFARFLASIQPTKEPELYFIHLMLPHRPWRYLPSGKEYEDQDTGTFGAIGGGGKATWPDEADITIEAYQRHLLQLSFVDRLLGQVIDKLQQTNLFDRSLIILTADHGISFRPGQPLRIPNKINYQDILLVPLLVKMPGQTTQRVVHANVENVDILPTIAGIVGLEIPEKIDGVSLFSADNTRKVKQAIVRGKLQKFPANLEENNDTLERKIALFGSRTPAEYLFRIGQDKQLIGKSVSELNPLTGNSTASVWKLPVYSKVDPNSPVAPVLIAGKVQPEPRTPVGIAVAINGTIRATTSTFENETGRFRAIVPDNSFRSGANTIQVLILPAKDGSPLLLARLR
jgi:hypothetical protein